MSSSSSASASATVRVEKATSDLLMGPDWTLNMDICDSVNSDQWQAKDVVKALKKRLQHKNPKVQFLSLMLLETMIKNCSDYIHYLVVEREILQEMVKIVRKKTDMQVRDKILVLLDSWQEAFGGAGGKYPQFYWAYSDLKRSGVQFPERSLDSTLIFTPVQSISGIRQPQIGHGMPINSALRLEEAMASEMSNLSLIDLASMRSVMDLLSEMLKALNTSDRAAVKDEVIVDLVDQCRSNQKKLMESINLIRDEELLGQGLELNDDLQNVLAKHDAIASGSPLQAGASELIERDPVAPQPTKPEVSESHPRTPIVPRPASQYDEVEEDDDDDFAQLARRNSKVNPPNSNSNSVATSNHLGSPGGAGVTVSSIVGSMGASSPPPASNALALPDPPTPVNTFTKEQDIISFLSIALSNSSPPHTPITPTSDQNVSSPTIPQAPQVNTSNAANQAYPPNNFITPWAQTQIRPSLSHPHTPPQQLSYSSSYPPPPWATAAVDSNANANANANPFASTMFQYPAPVNDAAATSVQASRTVLQYSSGSETNTTQSQGNTNPGQMRPSSAKPYVYTNRLFDELDLRNASTGHMTISSGSSSLSSSRGGQSTINGRK